MMLLLGESILFLSLMLELIGGNFTGMPFITFEWPLVSNFLSDFFLDGELFIDGELILDGELIPELGSL